MFRGPPILLHELLGLEGFRFGVVANFDEGEDEQKLCSLHEAGTHAHRNQSLKLLIYGIGVKG